jgi:hypothetical protein
MENHRTPNKEEKQTCQEPQIWEVNKANPEPANDCAKDPPQKWYKKIVWKEVLETVAVLVGIAVCKIYWDQLQVMSRQLGEMQGGSTQTSQLIVNAAHQASGIHDLAVAAGKQANQASIQARAAQDAANTSIKEFGVMQKQLEAADRPWVSITIYPSSALAYDGSTIRGQFLFIPKNVGRSPAQNVWINPRMVPFDFGQANEALQVEKEMCKQSELRIGRLPGYTLFAGDQFAQKIGLDLGSAALMAQFDKWKWPHDVPFLPVGIVGCIDYTFESSQRDHHTGFGFYITTKEGGGLLKKALPLQPDAIVMQTFPFCYFAD